MNRISAPILSIGALFLLCCAIWSIVLAPTDEAVRATGASVLDALAAPEVEGSSARVASVLQRYAASSSLEARQKTSGCAVRGPLPDPLCTPGAIFPSATSEIICVSGYTATVRSVSTSLRKKIYAAYGVSYPQPRGAYEVDHLIPLALGGSNDPANLFPEAAKPDPGFKEKDVVEVYLHDEMCAGRVSLAAAQRAIAADWTEVYTALDPEIIKEVRRRYSSWAN